MPNSERVLNRKVQVLIKIAPPLYFHFPKKYRDIREGVNLKKIYRVMKEGVHNPFSPPQYFDIKNKIKFNH